LKEEQMKADRFHSERNTKNYHQNAPSISRRDFLRLTLIASGGMGLWLAGCSPGAKQAVENEGPLVVVDEWIRALNAGDGPGFEKLHSESVLATTSDQSGSFSGWEQVWDVFSKSTDGQLEKIVAFSQDQSVCLLVNATRSNRSLCYVFNLVDGVIARVYEYTSGSYDLSSSAQFSGIEISGDDAGLQDRLDTVDYIFVESIESFKKNRDLSFPGVKESVIFFVPTSTEPVAGYENFVKDGKDYVSFFPSVSHKTIQTFGQGNLVCSHVAAQGTSKGSLCFVAVFQDEEIAEVYEFWSDARVDV
jgi:hypothetical protein